MNSSGQRETFQHSHFPEAPRDVLEHMQEIKNQVIEAVKTGDFSGIGVDHASVDRGPEDPPNLIHDFRDWSYARKGRRGNAHPGSQPTNEERFNFVSELLAISQQAAEDSDDGDKSSDRRAFERAIRNELRRGASQEQYAELILISHPSLKQFFENLKYLGYYQKEIGEYQDAESQKSLQDKTLELLRLILEMDPADRKDVSTILLYVYPDNRVRGSVAQILIEEVLDFQLEEVRWEDFSYEYKKNILEEFRDQLTLR